MSRRTLALIALAVAAATVRWAWAGLPARGLVRGHVGDVAAAMLVYAAWPARLRRWPRVGATLGVAFGIEAAQAWHRGVGGVAGDFVLGTAFDPWDLLAYVVGAAIAVAVSGHRSELARSSRTAR